MKKQTVLVSSLVAVLGLASAPLAMAAPAPHNLTIRFECPKASGGVVSERLHNFGTYIAGMGEENIGTPNVKTRPIFKGVSDPLIPSDLSTGGYNHAGTWFDNSTGRVICRYSSTLGFPNFNVSYKMENGKQ